MSLSASAVIVIAICGAAVAVTILFAFARYWGGPNILESKILTRSESQELYMRQVRQRSREYAYTEAATAVATAASASASASASAGGMIGPSAHTSQVWSNTGGIAAGGQTTPGTPGGYWTRQQQYGYPSPGASANSPGYVNYSSYDETGGQYYEQQASPYTNGNEYYYEYEQQQYPQRQTATAAVQPVNGESESSRRPVDEHALPPV